MAGQYPSWWGKHGGSNSPSGSTATNVATTANSTAVVPPNLPTTMSSPAQFYAFMAQVQDEPDGIIISYADSAASNHCFVR
jgi:hypothetical protein